MEIKQSKKDNSTNKFHPGKNKTEKVTKEVPLQPIEKEKSQFAFSIQLASELGFLITIPLLIGTFLGLYLDQRFGTKPILILVGVIIGTIISVGNVIRIMNRIVDS